MSLTAYLRREGVPGLVSRWTCFSFLICTARKIVYHVGSSCVGTASRPAGTFTADTRDSEQPTGPPTSARDDDDDDASLARDTQALQSTAKHCKALRITTPNSDVRRRRATSHPSARASQTRRDGLRVYYVCMRIGWSRHAAHCRPQARIDARQWTRNLRVRTQGWGRRGRRVRRRPIVSCRSSSRHSLARFAVLSAETNDFLANVDNTDCKQCR